jgi:hypothetical protein
MAASPTVAPGTPSDAEAFWEFLCALASSVRLRVDGEGLAAELIQMRAGAAAYRAFPMGSPESRALGVLLAAALRVTAQVIP